MVNPFTTGNPFLGTKLLGFSIGRGSRILPSGQETLRLDPLSDRRVTLNVHPGMHDATHYTFASVHSRSHAHPPEVPAEFLPRFAEF